MTKRRFGTLPDGTDVDVYSLRSAAIEIDLLTYGGIIASLRVPDRNGRVGDVVLGHDTLDPYLSGRSYFGAIVGRYANRIARGRFELDGVVHQLATNDGANHLHGGLRGFDRRLWSAERIDTATGEGVALSRTSPDGEEHYPGTLDVRVTYVLANDTLVIEYEAAVDAPTIVNLTQHTYFNLDGETSSSALDHELTMHADRYTPVGEGLIPTGEIVPVDATPFDFRTPHTIRAGLAVDHEQLRRAGGLDHNFVVNDGPSRLSPSAELTSVATGRRLIVSTTEPGVQFYSGHLLDGSVRGAYGRVFAQYAGVCLETQHFPDSPNHPSFPSTTLRPGERYRSTTTWQFTPTEPRRGDVLAG